MPRYGQVQVSFGPPLTRMVKYLIIVTGAIFVLTYLGLQLFHWTWPLAWLSLQPYDVIHRLFLWQLVTYLFLHGGFFHIIFNLLMLWMFGSELEYRWGGRRFLFYFFLTGIGAGFCDVVLNTLLAPGLRTATIGNSGAVYGVLLAYGMLFPDRPVLFALMIPMKAKWLVLIMGAIEFLSSLGGPGSGISHFAHLGGMLFGFLYLRGASLPYVLRLRYDEWRRARLRKKFAVYMREHESKDDAGRWIH